MSTEEAAKDIYRICDKLALPYSVAMISMGLNRPFWLTHKEGTGENVTGTHIIELDFPITCSEFPPEDEYRMIYLDMGSEIKHRCNNMCRVLRIVLRKSRMNMSYSLLFWIQN